jgi:transcriptional regulator GlxA family with amidase domain
MSIKKLSAADVKKIKFLLGQNESVSVLAKKWKLYPSKFDLLFQKATGQTPREYKVESLLIDSQMWLTQTNVPVNQIHAMCNFKSHPGFNDFFQKNMRITPIKYRKKYGFRESKNPAFDPASNSYITEKNLPGIKNDLENNTKTVKQIGRELGYSHKGFSGAFKSFTGLTPKKYQQKMIAGKSIKLLLATNKPILEIASICHLEYHALIRIVKAETGYAPTAYRDKYGYANKPPVSSERKYIALYLLTHKNMSVADTAAILGYTSRIALRNSLKGQHKISVSQYLEENKKNPVVSSPDIIAKAKEAIKKWEKSKEGPLLAKVTDNPKIEATKLFLAATELDMEAIAPAVGYKNAVSLTGAFNSLTRMGWETYRNLYSPVWESVGLCASTDICVQKILEEQADEDQKGFKARFEQEMGMSLMQCHKVFQEEMHLAAV